MLAAESEAYACWTACGGALRPPGEESAGSGDLDGTCATELPPSPCGGGRRGRY